MSVVNKPRLWYVIDHWWFANKNHFSMANAVATWRIRDEDKCKNPFFIFKKPNSCLFNKALTVVSSPCDDKTCLCRHVMLPMIGCWWYGKTHQWFFEFVLRAYWVFRLVCLWNRKLGSSNPREWQVHTLVMLSGLLYFVPAVLLFIFTILFLNSFLSLFSIILIVLMHTCWEKKICTWVLIFFFC